MRRLQQFASRRNVIGIAERSRSVRGRQQLVKTIQQLFSFGFRERHYTFECEWTVRIADEHDIVIGHAKPDRGFFFTGEMGPEGTSVTGYGYRHLVFALRVLQRLRQQLAGNALALISCIYREIEHIATGKGQKCLCNHSSDLKASFHGNGLNDEPALGSWQYFVTYPRRFRSAPSFTEALR